MDAYAEGFNRGSDARIAGIPPSGNPFGTLDASRYGGWRAGWLDCDLYWGSSAKTRVRPLPLILEVASVRKRRFHGGQTPA